MMNARSEQKRASKEISPVDALSKTIEALESRLDSLIEARSRKPVVQDEAPPAIDFDPKRDPIAQLRETQNRLDAYRERGRTIETTASAPKPSTTPAPERTRAPLPEPRQSRTAAAPRPSPAARAPLAQRPLPPRPQPKSAAPATSRASAAPTDTAVDSDLREVASAIVALRRELRSELRSDLSADFARQIASLQDDIKELHGIASNGGVPEMLHDDLVAISRSIEAMGENDPHEVKALRNDIADLRQRIDNGNHEDVLQSLDQRWADICAMMSDMEPAAIRSDIDSLGKRVDEIATAITALPDAARSERIEQELTSLAGIVDRLASEAIAQLSAADFAKMESRLDDISQAVLDAYDSDAVKARDAGMREHIDGRFADFGERLRSTEDRLTDSLVQQLDGLVGRIEGFTDRADLSPLLARLDALSLQVGELSLSAGSDELRDIMQHLSDMNARIDDLGQTISDQAGVVETQNSTFIGRFEDLLERAEGQWSQDHFGTIYEQLDGITERLDQPRANSDVGELEAQIATLTEILNLGLGDLERQSGGIADIEPRLAAIEGHLAHSGIDIIEAATKAAEAAVASFVENGLAGFEGTDDELTVVAGLAEDLRALERATRQSDERNTRTFDAVQETLLKIAERLESLDTLRASTGSTEPRGEIAPIARQASAKLAPAAAAVTARSESVADADWKIEVKGKPESPAVAPAVAAKAPERFKPLHDDDDEFWYGKSDFVHTAQETPPAADDDQADHDVHAAEPAQRRSLLGRLTGQSSAKAPALTTAHAPQAAAAPEPRMRIEDAPSLDPVETMDAAAADEPLEPGSGAPDIEHILQKVRAHQDEAPSLDPSASIDGSKADLIAAARRAAKAAADDTDVSDEKPRRGGKGGGGSSGSLGSRKRPVLIAVGAVLLALMSYPIVTKLVPESEAPVAALDTAGEESENAALADTDTDTESDVADVAATPSDPKAAEERDTTATASVSPNEAQTAEDAYDVASLPSGLPAPLVDAARSGDGRALFEIGSRFAEGRGVDADPETAAEWYRNAAAEDFAPAQYRLGNLYETGTGVEADLDEARRWYQAAADRGNASAMHNLAVIYASTGVDGEPDFDIAAEWFKQAAERGISDSQFNLAVLYARGSGVERDLVQSYKWFAIAANAGDEDAAEKRDEVGAALEEGELARARTDADSWLPIPLESEANTFEAPQDWQVSSAAPSNEMLKQAVAEIQTLLNSKGFDAGTPDGVIGDKTIKAIQDYQTAGNQAPTGTLDRGVVQALLEEARRA